MTRYTNAGCTLSPCEQFRYRLWRHWDDGLPVLVWIMLNPSWGDANRDDNTIKKCVAFAKLWGYGGIEIVNLFAYRTHSPDVLRQKGYPGFMGDRNMQYLHAVIKQHKDVLCAWGGNARCSAGIFIIDKVKAMVTKMQETMHIHTRALKVSADGTPWHPLYVSYKTERVYFNLFEDEL